MSSKAPRPKEVTLNEAIDSASKEQLTMLLKRVVATNPQAKETATAHLLIPVDGSTSQKRKAFEICQNYDQEYSVADNDEEDCAYHDGEKELIEDFWADHDDDRYGDPSILIEGGDYEDGYTWTCCNKLGDEPGCVVEHHVPKGTRHAKKHRWHSEPEEGKEENDDSEDDDSEKIMLRLLAAV